jgi:hypothetical protein
MSDGMYCCSQMERLSQPDGVIHHTSVNKLAGIRTSDGHAFITIGVCPWCGTNVSIEFDKALIGKSFVEVR